MKLIQIAGWVVVAGCAISAVLWASAKHDKLVDAAMQRYDDCMVRTYGVTAAHWYAEHESLPECK